MSREITDSSGAVVTSIPLLLDEQTDSQVVALNIPCLANRWLTTADDASARVLARVTSVGGAFVDIQTSPIDLTPYDGQTVSFDFKVHANNITGLVHVALPVRITAVLP